MYKILLISPFPPSQNPRLLKEYQALKAAGFEVKALYAERDSWSSNHKVPEGFERVGGKVGSFWHWMTRVIHRVSKIFLPYEYHYNRVSLLLLRRALTIKADLYIGHELTTLPIVVKAAKKYKSKCGFDIEDFHRNEVSNDIGSYQYLAASAIENKYINQVNYITAASPLIAESYQTIYPDVKSQVINNVFSNKHIVNDPIKPNASLKLFWFSQTVGKGRGLELVLEAMAKLSQLPISLALLGNADKQTKLYFQALVINSGLTEDRLNFLSPVKPEDIFNIANQHDIGLALELRTPKNRDICLTNKIFTYLNSGLAILASNTLAQQKLISENANIGTLFNSGDLASITSALENYYKHPEFLKLHREQARQIAKTKFNCELESQKFISLINSTL